MLLVTSCATNSSKPPELPKAPEPQACTLEEKPPLPDDLSMEDYGIGGQDEGCDAKYEVCLTIKSAKHYLDIQNYADEAYSKCKRKQSNKKL